jgi:hypothetical protein
MSLSDLASLGSFVSGVAVLASLVYLALQVRQTERNQQTAIRHSRISRIVEFNVAVSDPGVTEAWTYGLRRPAQISETQQTQFLSLCRGFYYHLEDSFYQHEEGLLNEDAFETVLAGARSFAGHPGARAAWTILRRGFGGSFLQFMDGVVAQARDLPSDTALSEEWKAACATEALTAS